VEQVARPGSVSCLDFSRIISIHFPWYLELVVARDQHTWYVKSSVGGKRY